MAGTIATLVLFFKLPIVPFKGVASSVLAALARRFKDHIVVSFEEVIRLMETTEAGAAVSAVKQVFPGATLAAGRIPKGGDEIPF